MARSRVRGVATVDVDGSALAYDIDGAGEAAFAFVHGWCSKAEHWQAQASYFEPNYRVVRWDRRGMGRSREARAADTPQRHADDLAAIMDRVDVGAVAVVGHAGGGPAAVTFAATYPDRVTHLVLVDTRLHAAPATGEDAFAAASSSPRRGCSMATMPSSRSSTVPSSARERRRRSSTTQWPTLSPHPGQWRRQRCFTSVSTRSRSLSR
jgi:pimeloyl-ACP methyl ester carboxylesterase